MQVLGVVAQQGAWCGRVSLAQPDAGAFTVHASTNPTGTHNFSQVLAGCLDIPAPDDPERITPVIVMGDADHVGSRPQHQLSVHLPPPVILQPHQTAAQAEDGSPKFGLSATFSTDPTAADGLKGCRSDGQQPVGPTGSGLSHLTNGATHRNSTSMHHSHSTCPPGIGHTSPAASLMSFAQNWTHDNSSGALSTHNNSPMLTSTMRSSAHAPMFGGHAGAHILDMSATQSRPLFSQISLPAGTFTDVVHHNNIQINFPAHIGARSSGHAPSSEGASGQFTVVRSIGRHGPSKQSSSLNLRMAPSPSDSAALSARARVLLQGANTVSGCRRACSGGNAHPMSAPHGFSSGRPSNLADQQVGVQGHIGSGQSMDKEAASLSTSGRRRARPNSVGHASPSHQIVSVPSINQQEVKRTLSHRLVASASGVQGLGHSADVFGGSTSLQRGCDVGNVGLMPEVGPDMTFPVLSQGTLSPSGQINLNRLHPGCSPGEGGGAGAGQDCLQQGNEGQPGQLEPLMEFQAEVDDTQPSSVARWVLVV